MFEIGDSVIYKPDGSRGIVLEMKDGRCHVVWEDHFVSWEKAELLVKIDVKASRNVVY